MHIFDESYDNGEKKKKYTQKEQQRITSPTLQQQIASVLRYAIDNAVKVFQDHNKEVTSIHGRSVAS